jgi:hypothetical protein
LLQRSSLGDADSFGKPLFAFAVELTLLDICPSVDAGYMAISKQKAIGCASAVLCHIRESKRIPSLLSVKPRNIVGPTSP